MLKNLKLRIAAWLLGTVSNEPIRHDPEKAKAWLAESWAREEARGWLADRLYSQVKLMASGIEGRDYWQAYGRRMELLSLLSDMEVEARIREEARRRR